MSLSDQIIAFIQSKQEQKQDPTLAELKKLIDSALDDPRCRRRAESGKFIYIIEQIDYHTDLQKYLPYLAIIFEHKYISPQFIDKTANGLFILDISTMLHRLGKFAHRFDVPQNKTSEFIGLIKRLIDKLCEASEFFKETKNLNSHLAIFNALYGIASFVKRHDHEIQPRDFYCISEIIDTLAYEFSEASHEASASECLKTLWSIFDLVNLIHSDHYLRLSESITTLAKKLSSINNTTEDTKDYATLWIIAKLAKQKVMHPDHFQSISKSVTIFAQKLSERCSTINAKECTTTIESIAEIAKANIIHPNDFASTFASLDTLLKRLLVICDTANAQDCVKVLWSITTLADRKSVV